MTCSRHVRWAIHIVEVDVEVSVVVGGTWRRAVLLLKVCIVVGGVAEVAGEGSEQTNGNTA